MSEFNFGGEFAWFPTPEAIENSHLHRFMQRQHGLATLAELQEQSVEDIPGSGTRPCAISTSNFTNRTRPSSISQAGSPGRSGAWAAR